MIERKIMKKIRLYFLKRRISKNIEKIISANRDEYVRYLNQKTYIFNHLESLQKVKPASYLDNNLNGKLNKSIKDAFPQKSPINRHDLSDFDKIVMADDLLKKYQNRTNPKFFILPYDKDMLPKGYPNDTSGASDEI